MDAPAYSLCGVPRCCSQDHGKKLEGWPAEQRDGDEGGPGPLPACRVAPTGSGVATRKREKETGRTGSCGRPQRGQAEKAPWLRPRRAGLGTLRRSGGAQRPPRDHREHCRVGSLHGLDLGKPGASSLRGLRWLRPAAWAPQTRPRILAATSQLLPPVAPWRSSCGRRGRRSVPPPAPPEPSDLGPAPVENSEGRRPTSKTIKSPEQSPLCELIFSSVINAAWQLRLLLP
ncbi:hypothetical protein NN561_011566 [Cricetulus griseus]